MNQKIFFVLLLATLLSLSFSSHSQATPNGDYAFEIYKKIHQYPELGKKEFKTSDLIREELKKIGYTEFDTIKGLKTCVIAVLDTKRKGPIRAFRAELDAIPGKEESGLLYASKIDTVMHACGHDAHAAILLGTARLLYSIQGKFTGKIYFIFQPAEEISGGAIEIVKSNFIEQHHIKNIYALHSASGLAVGKLSVSPGPFSAGSNYFSIAVKGDHSHVATPDSGSNIPVLTAKIIDAIFSIPKTKMDTAERPCVISITYVECGTPKTRNVIPDSSIIKGTIRTYEPVDSSYNGQSSIRDMIKAELDSLSKAYKATCALVIKRSTPPASNDSALFQIIIPRLKNLYTGSIDTTPYRGMFSEDFAYYTKKIPCLYFGLGIAGGLYGYKGEHSSKFSVNRDAFIRGIELFSDIALMNY